MRRGLAPYVSSKHETEPPTCFFLEEETVRPRVLEATGHTGTHATLFTAMYSHHLTQDSAGRPMLSLKLMEDAAFRR